MGKYLTVEERLKVLELKKQGMQQKRIAKEIGRSPSAVSYLIHKGEHSVLRMKVDAETPKKIEDAERPPEKDLSSLPDTVLFREIKWAIPVLIVVFCSCAAQKTIQYHGTVCSGGASIQEMHKIINGHDSIIKK